MQLDTSGQILVDGMVLPVKRSAIVATATGNSTLVAAVSGKKIRVLAINFVVNATDTLYVRSASGGAFNLQTSSPGTLGGNRNILYPYMPHGWFETVAGEALVLNGGSNNSSAQCWYVEV